MSIVLARRKRSALYLSICGLLLMVAAVSAVSARDPSGVWLRAGMIMMTVGASMWLPRPALLPAVLLVWLVPNGLRSNLEDLPLFSAGMMLELPGVLGLGLFAALARRSLHLLEEENILIGTTNDAFIGVDNETGVYEERLLLPAIEAELARSRRFRREFALVLVGLPELRERFDYRDDESWQMSLAATAGVLRSTRSHIDRVYRYGPSSFALLLPESGAGEVTGLVRRLRRVARNANPAEGQPLGPLPTHYGATFFPQSATTTDDLLRRAEVALRLAEKSASRLQLDGAEAPAMPPLQNLRQERDEPEVAEAEPQRLAAVPDPADGGTTTPTAMAGPQPRLVLVGASSSDDGRGEGLQSPLVVLMESSPEAQPAARWQHPETPSLPAAPPASAAAEPALRLVPREETQPLDDAVSDLLKHLDETLGLIRTLKSAAS